MLSNTNEMDGYAVTAPDGVLGHVKDFYFDDKQWVIRYLVVDTGTWMSSRKVLVSPIAVGSPNRDQKTLPTSISKEKLRNSPDIDTEKPVSRQHEILHSDYYDLPYYWGGSGYWGAGMYPNLMLSGMGGRDGLEPTASEAQHEIARDETAKQGQDDPHLRSCKAVVGYHIHASDGTIGHVSGMLIDERSWAVRYLVVDTSNWWMGHEVLIAPQWIDSMNWFDETVAVSMSRQVVQDAPVYNPQVALTQEAEDQLHQHYGRASPLGAPAPRDSERSHL